MVYAEVTGSVRVGTVPVNAGSMLDPWLSFLQFLRRKLVRDFHFFGIDP